VSVAQDLQRPDLMVAVIVTGTMGAVSRRFGHKPE
jgi:hypothetical protein